MNNGKKGGLCRYSRLDLSWFPALAVKLSSIPILNFPLTSMGRAKGSALCTTGLFHLSVSKETLFTVSNAVETMIRNNGQRLPST